MGRFQAAALCRELGAELRKYRKAAGLSENELADKAGWWPAKVSRMESGRINASDIDVVQYLAYCGAWLGEVQDIIDLCRLAERQLGYWISKYGKYKEDSLRSLIFHETTANAAISYEPHFVPGLLQTESYARSVFSRHAPLAEEDLEFCVNARMTRQQVMYRPSPARFTYFLHEHVFGVTVADQAVMHEQVLALMLLDGLPNVTIRVMPESSTIGGAFRLFRFAKHNSLVYLDALVGAMFLEDKEYVGAYENLVPGIADVALNEGQSREYLAALANKYDRGSAHDHVEEKQL